MARSTPPGGAGACGGTALHAALDFAEASPSRRDEIIYLSDGGARCGEDETAYLTRTLEEVTARNRGRARIHTFGVLDSLVGQFLKALAEQNRGTFTR